MAQLVHTLNDFNYEENTAYMLTTSMLLGT